MLPTVTLVVATCMAVFSALIAGLSLVLHWARGKEHPDVSAVSRSVQELALAHADLVDKVTHWQRRDRVRKLRESHEGDAHLQQQLPFDPKAHKEQLRRQVFGGPANGDS